MIRIGNRTKSIAYYIALYASMLALFWKRIGFEVLNPFNLKWLYQTSSDYLIDVTSWQYYLHSGPTGRLGTISGYAMQTVGIGNLNQIPWLAMPTKWIAEIFSLPDVQHFGFYILLSLVAHTIYTDKILGHFSIKHGVCRYLVMLVCLLNAPYLDRLGHIALFSFWAISASFYYYLNLKQSILGNLVAYSVISFLAATTHPYLILFPMAVALATAFYRYTHNHDVVLKLALYLILPIGMVLLGFWVSGVFSLPFGSSKSLGFGYYSANTNTFFNTIGKCNNPLLDLKIYKPGQYEGFAYLGIGMLVVWVVLLVRYKLFLPTIYSSIVAHRALFVITALLLSYAFAFEFSWGDQRVLGINTQASNWFIQLCSVFKSSGRYVWLAYFFIILWPLKVLYHTAHGARWFLGLLITVSVMQLWDLWPLTKSFFQKEASAKPPAYSELSLAVSNSESVFTWPILNRTIVHNDDVQLQIANCAPKQIPITAGYLPRNNFYEKQKLERLIAQFFDSGKWIFGQRSIFILSKNDAAKIHGLQHNASVTAKSVDEYLILFPNTHKKMQALSNKWNDWHIAREHLLNFFKQHQAYHIVVVSSDESTNGMDTVFKQYAQGLHSAIGQRPYRSAYIGHFFKGALINEWTDTSVLTKTISITNQANQAIHLSAISTIGPQAQSSIELHGKPLMHCNRGLNIVVLDSNLNVVKLKQFDTYEQMYAPGEIVLKP